MRNILHSHAIVCQLAKIVQRGQLSQAWRERGVKGQSLKNTKQVLTNRKSSDIIFRIRTLYARSSNHKE